MVIPPIYVEFPQSGKSKELLYLKKEIPVDRVELEKRFDDIIPDIVVYSGDKYFFIEIYVSVPSRFMRKFICRLRLNEVSRQ